MISTHSRSSLSRSARQGFSLIEVAIALVIFVIGALAIIRIFPGALSVIGNNGDQQLATNLNRSVAARLQSENAVPYANFNIAVNADANNTLKWTTEDNTNHTADFSDIDASVIGVPRFNNSLPTPEDINTEANNSALSRFRGIQGEKIKPTALIEGGVAVEYALTQFPISFAKVNGGSDNELLLPTISQEYIIRNARMDKQGNVFFTDATVTDGAGTTVLLRDTTEEKKVFANSTVYVSYRYINTDTNGNAQVWGVNDEPSPIAADVPDLTATGVFLSVDPPTTTRGARTTYDPNNPTTTGAVAELVDVRVKRYLGVGAFGPSTNPTPIQQVGDARRGMVRLDALTNTRIANVPYSVDYIADWSFLLQEGPASLTPSATPDPPTLTGTQTYRQIALGAPFIDEQKPASVYSLLIESNTPSRSYFGTDNPDPIAADKLVRPTSESAREDELRSGKVTFIVENSASRARVAYQTRANWVQQLAVAANAYKPYALRPVTGGAPTVTEPWRDYYLGDDNYLYFHAGEAGKTISVSYRTVNASGPLVERPFVIETQLVKVPTAFYNGLGARVELSAANGVAFKDDTTGDVLTSIQAVKGTSVTVRTAYINGSKYVQTLLTSNRGTN